MSSREREFLDFYERQRVEDQLGYYRRTAARLGRRDDQLIVLTGLLMFAASASAAVVAAGIDVIALKAVAALVPAISAAVAATRALYELERNRARYEDTYRDLEYLRAYKAPSSALSDDDYGAALAEYVHEVEELLSQEQRQWVETMEQIQLAEPPPGGTV
ncbi:MAG: SLATT domain-containing protein [Gemmatimonadota bacterium]|nr:MAG: SLATT domain-containing protein [Gemmatimonadota bacterium]